MNASAPIGPLLAFVFPGPIEVIAFRQLHLLIHFLDRLPHRAAEIASADAVFDRDIARVALAVNRRRAIIEANLANLSQRNPLARGSHQTNVRDVINGAAERLLIAQCQVVTLFADQHLADGLAADRGLDRILNIGDVDAVAIGGRAIDHQVHIRLAAHLECAQIGDAGNLRHHILNFVGLRFECLQIGAEES